MSKKENAFYYSFTSPSVPTSSSSSSRPSAPPENMDSAPPPYDEAVIPSSAAAEPSPPPNRPSYDGYVLDSSSPPFNPGLPSQNSTGDYGPYIDNPADGQANAPLLGDIQSRSEEYEEFAGRPAPPNYSLYRAKYKTVKDGVISRDKHINNDPEALVQFLYQHNTRPRMTIHFYGYHEETEYNTISTRNSDGELVQERQPTTRRIDDFNFDFKVDDEVSTTCQGIYITPDKNTGENKTLRDLCNDYIREKNILKELKLTKEINWDFSGLTRALTTAIRNSGFYENIEISFQMENHEIIVKTDHDISRWIDNKYIRFFFFITFLWVITWPIIWFYRKRFGHKTLKSSWNMTISERDWYAMHIQEVVNSCKGTNVFFRSNNPRSPNVRFNGLFR